MNTLESISENVEPPPGVLAVAVVRQPALSEADLRLIETDTAVAGLETVLSPELFLDRLREQMPEISWTDPSVTYVQYKPRATCLVGYRVQANGKLLELYAKAYSKRVVPGRRPNRADLLERLGTRPVNVTL